MVHGLARAAAGHGAEVATGTRVEAVTPVAGRRRWLAVATSRGLVHCRQVVYACSHAVAALVPQLADALRPTVAQVLATAPMAPRLPVGLAVDWGSVFWRQTADGSIVLGDAAVAPIS